MCVVGGAPGGWLRSAGGFVGAISDGGRSRGWWQSCRSRGSLAIAVLVFDVPLSSNIDKRQ